MLNHIWLWMILLSILIAAGNDLINEASDPEMPEGIKLEMIREPAVFLEKVGRAQSKPAAYLRDQLSSATRNQLDKYLELTAIAEQARPSTELVQSVINEFNLLIKEYSIYDPLIFESVKLSDDLRQKAKESIRNKDVLGTNLQLLQAAFPGQIMLERPLNQRSHLGRVADAAINASGLAVKIALGLIGVMALWLGIMKLAEEAGLVAILARLVRPVTRRLFPSVPGDHPAITAMMMNVAANMLGLSNAATPFGLKAMEELNKINPEKNTASDDMITFLVINTSAITLVPATAIAIRAAMGSVNPQQIIIPSILAATMATIAGLTTVKVIQLFNGKKGNGNLKETKDA